MKKFKLSIIIFLFTLVSFAQNLSIGFKDGIRWTGVHFQDDGSYRFNNKNDGRNTGIVANYQINNRLSLQIELNFLGKGFEFRRYMSTGGGYRGDYKLNYISVPLIGHYELGKKVKYYGFAGVYTDFFESVENHNTNSSTAHPYPVRYDNSYDASGEFNKIDLGYLLGIGLKIPACDKVKFFIESRYTSGLTKAVKDYREKEGYRIPESIKNIYNYAFSINWGILFTIPKKE